MRTRRILGGLSAAVLLAVLLGGVPLLLVVGLGNPLPDWSALRAGNVSDTMVLQLLGCVLWLAWAQWVPGTLLEMAAGFRDTRAQRSAKLRHLGREPRHISAGQGLSRALVAAVVGLAIAAPIAASAGPRASASPAGVVHAPAAATAPTLNGASVTPDDGPTPSRAAQTRSRSTAASASLPVFVVGSDPTIGPSLWSIAQHTMGDPMRWRDIWALNRDQPMSGRTVFADPDEIRDGWRLRLPADATVPGVEPAAPGARVTVRRGDTIDTIARDELHVDPQRLIDTNLGRSEPGGRVFDDPDLILPGWKLTVPSEPGSASPLAGSTGSRAGHAPPDAPRPPTPADPPSQTPTRQSEQRNSTEPNHSPGPARLGPDAASAQRPSIELPMVAFLGGGVLLAGVSLSALSAYRRRQFRLRHPGNIIKTSPPGLLRVERSLLSTGGHAVLDVMWLDHVLRGLVHGMHCSDDPATQAARLPDVVAARLTRDELELVLAAPQPDAPSPWTVDDSGTRWTLPRDRERDYDPSRRAYLSAPFPTLASVGYATDGSQWLLDLERLASMSLAGDPEHCVNLARFVACELAHNTWSEMLQVTMVGFGQELVEGNPDRLSHVADFDAAIADLGQHIDSTIAAVRDSGTGVLVARTSAGSCDVPVPHVVLIAADAARDTDGLDRLLATMRKQGSRMAVAIMLAGDAHHAETTTWKLTVDAEGTLHIPGLGLDLIAHQLPADEAAEIAQLLALVATTSDAPMPPSAGNNPWDRVADAAGALRLPAEEDQMGAGSSPENTLTGADGQTHSSPNGTQPAVNETPCRADGPLHPTDSSGKTRTSVLPLPSHSYLERAATTSQDMEALAPETNDDIRLTVESSVGDLDADLAEWYDDASVRPRVSVLGPVRVRAQGPLPTRNPRIPWHTEIVAYLATRPSGVSSEEYGAALWPNDPDINGKSKVRQSVMIVRKWLGKNPATGHEYLPPATAPAQASYRIDDCLLDAELFRRLRLRGVARGADGIDDLWSALRLVTGPPFSERRQEGYAWLAENPLHHIYQAMIVDAAHTVATHHLGAGEADRAADAAQVALLAGSTEDIPLLDQVAAFDAQDMRAEANALVKRILVNHDADVEEDLPPRTAEVLIRRQWLDPAS